MNDMFTRDIRSIMRSSQLEDELAASFVDSLMQGSFQNEHPHTQNSFGTLAELGFAPPGASLSPADRFIRNLDTCAGAGQPRDARISSFVKGAGKHAVNGGVALGGMRRSESAFLEKSLKGLARAVRSGGVIKALYSNVLPTFSGDEKWKQTLKRVEAIHVLGFKAIDIKIKDVLPRGLLAKVDLLAAKAAAKLPQAVKKFEAIKRFVSRPVMKGLLQGAKPILKFVSRLSLQLTILDMWLELTARQMMESGLFNVQTA